MKENLLPLKKTETVIVGSSFWRSILDIFKTPKLAFGAAFALLLLVFAGWILLRNPSPNPIDIVSQISPTQTITVAPSNTVNNQNSPIESNINSQNKNAVVEITNKNQLEKKPTDQPPPKQIVTMLALFAGSVRSEGKTNELKLAQETTGANLQYLMERV